ncbi:MAG: IS1634 family transposase [Candidatus Binatia bacterium]
MNAKTELAGKIIERKRGRQRYYYYSRSYRQKIDPNAQGKTKGTGKSRGVNEQIYLGAAETVHRKLVQAEDPCDPVDLKTKHFGLPVALFDMAERVGLRDIIDEVVPYAVEGIAVSDFMLIGAINRVGNHTPKESMGKWYDKTALSKIQKVNPGKLDSKSFWYAYDHVVSEANIRKEKEARGLGPSEKLDIDELEAILDDSKVEQVEKRLWQNLSKKFGFLLDAVLYDTANFYNFCQPDTPNSLSQFGKNKEGRDDKRQVGLQLAILRELGIPIFHGVYCGHQNDAALFPTAIRKLSARYHEVTKKTESLVLVFDKGNNSKKNLSALEGSEFRIDFVGTLTASHHPDLMRIPLTQYTESFAQFRVHRTNKKVFGMDRDTVLTYHGATAKRQEKIFEFQMKRVMKEAKAFFETIAQESTAEAQAQMRAYLKTQKVGASQALRYYDFKVWHNGWKNMFSLRRKRSEVDRKKATFGKKIVFTSLRDATTETLLGYQKDSFQIEESFHHLKDRDLVAYYPGYHWTDSKIRVHAFVCVLALLLLKLLQFLARKSDSGMSCKVLIEELEDITMVISVYPDNKTVKRITTLSTVQKRLFALYGLDKYT